MLTREMLVAELKTLQQRENQLAAELNQIIGARQFCEFAIQQMDKAEQPEPMEAEHAGTSED